nr:ribonuclease H-like domain-containing protein [Tanacetum cinerariifolium]
MDDMLPLGEEPKEEELLLKGLLKLNMVLVVKSHNKTPYELFRGRTHALSFMRPFGCHVTILNTLDNLGKFDGKSDDGFFIGYSLNSDGPKWLFDIDVLTKSMNYVPVVVGTNFNDFVAAEESIGEGHSSKEKGSSQDYILIPLWKDGSLFDSSSTNASNDKPQPSSDAGHKDNEGVSKESEIDNQEKPKNSTQDVNTAGPSINTASINVNTEVDLSNILNTYLVPSTPNTRIHKDHSLDHMDVKSVFLYGKIEEEVYVCQPLGFEDPEFPDKVYKVEKALYGPHQALRAWYETLSTYLLDNGFQREYVAAASCCGQVLWIQNQMLDYGYNFMTTKIFIDNEITICIKPTESKGFKQIIDFLNANPIKYVLTVNLTIYTSCIKQFWATTKVKTVNGDEQIQALVDKKKVIIIETSVRSDLHLEDAEEDMGEDSEIQTNSHHIPTVTQPSTSSQPQQKQKSKKSKKRITEVIKRMHPNKGVFDTSILDDEEVVAKKEVSTADPVPTAGKVVTNAGVEVNTAAITSQISMDEITLAKALIDIKTSKPKAKGIVMQEPSETPTPTPIDSSQQPSKAKDKGKAKMIGPEKPLKRKDQIMIDDEVAKNLEAQLQAELEEEDRLARQKEVKANIARIEEKNESTKLKRCLEMIPDDEDVVTIEATPLSSKSSTIVDYKIYKEGRKSFFKIIRTSAKLCHCSTVPTIPSLQGNRPNQTSFLAGRQILDDCLIANKLIRMASLEDHKLLLFKVDFEKPLVVQGDPFSSFLFLLVVETLQVSILEACNKGFFKGVSLFDIGDNLSLLQYADDTLFFDKWSRSNANNLILILKCFEEASGSEDAISQMGSVQNRGVGSGLASPRLQLVETLQVSILEACNKGFFKGVSIFDIGDNLSLLQYADDTLFFDKWSQSNANNLILILKCFKEASDPWVNEGSWLKDLYPRLFALDSYQDCVASDRWGLINGSWSNLDLDLKSRYSLEIILDTFCGPHDTRYCIEDPEQAFVEYASSRTDEAGGKCPSRWKYLSKETSSNILPCGDGS